MKKILSILLCLALMMGGALADMKAAPGSPAEAYGAPAPGTVLGMNLLSMLHVSGENTILSPWSLAVVLAMAAEGAQGETLDEMLAALKVQSVSDISTALPDGLKSANAVFTAPDLALEQAYIDRLNADYAAEWFELDADVAERVNGWVAQHTDGLIEEMMNEAPADEIAVLLLNAVAMDADWASPFSPEATAEAVFHAADGDVNVQMMHQTAYFDYAEKDGMQIVRLPYQQGGLDMWIALPPEGGMAQLLEILAGEGMFYLESDAGRREVILSLPKVDASDDNSLRDALMLLGIETAFSADAVFSGMSSAPLCVDEVLQKARIQIDEQGTRAAAATMASMRLMAMLSDQQPVEMNVDRPFAFVISDSETGSVYFAGAIENPVKG